MIETMDLKEILAEPQTLDDLHIPQSILIDIILRILYSEGNVTFRRIVQVVKTPVAVSKLMDWMRQEHILEISPSSFSLGPFDYIYKLTDAGEERAKEALERGQYIGPAPVPVHYYNRAIDLQTKEVRQINVQDVLRSLSDLILDPDFHRRIGPAINSGSSLFMYGPTGNGKTTIAHQIGKMIAATTPIWLPYAITAGGQIIQIHDRLVHKPAPPASTDRQGMGNVDGRWELFLRPTIIVGGELMLEGLDLRYDPITKIYEAPLQLKSNGGMFLLDDFGRQLVSPADLLNRWIIPLEEGVDYLRLRTGQTVVVPFRQLIIFSTNLEPTKLADDAFYRRIQIKVAVDSPDEPRYQKIFRKVCEQMGIPFDEAAYQYLLGKWYQGTGRSLQCVHPRDLLGIVKALCEYANEPFHMSPKLLDEACMSYFVETED